MGTIGACGETISAESMRRLILILLMSSLAGCTAMLLGGAQTDQAEKDCKTYPDQEHCK
jgi:hypothetical protein